MLHRGVWAMSGTKVEAKLMETTCTVTALINQVPLFSFSE
jgi:hypothetical protein